MITIFRATIFQFAFAFILGGAVAAQSEPDKAADKTAQGESGKAADKAAQGESGKAADKAAQSEFDKAIANYRQVVEKDDFSATEEAIKMFQSVLSKNPAEHRATVYSGSLTARLAGLAWTPWNKLRYVYSGIDMMDKGVEAVDQNSKDPQVVIESHMIRGITSARIPKAFKRESVAVADFKFIRNHPAFDKTHDERKVRVLAYSAVLAHRQEDAAGAADFLSKARLVNREIAEKIWADR